MKTSPRNLLSASLACGFLAMCSAHAAPLILVNTSFEYGGSGNSFTEKTDQYNDGGPDIYTVGVQGFTLSGTGDIGVENNSSADNPDNAGIRSVAYFSNSYVQQVTPYDLNAGTYAFTLSGVFTNAQVTLGSYDGFTFTPIASTLAGTTTTAVVAVGSADKFAFRVGSGDNNYVGADTFSADFTPVPEPSGLALMGLAGAVAFLRRRRRTA